MSGLTGLQFSGERERVAMCVCVSDRERERMCADVCVCGTRASGGGDMFLRSALPTVSG